DNLLIIKRLALFSVVMDGIEPLNDTFMSFSLKYSDSELLTANI
ncbi:hypothetical protein FHS68_005370, partial [Dyadobacter arcticus]|nr:hypothetical protein [Dyadobacter arcticus]